MGAKPGGIRSTNIFSKKDTNTFVPSFFCKTQSQSSVIKFSSFFFLSPEVSNNKLGVDKSRTRTHTPVVDRGDVPQNCKDLELKLEHHVD